MEVQFQACSNQKQANFGSLVRHIVQTNSGQFPAIGAPTSVTNRLSTERTWCEYKDLAEAATAAGNYSQAEAMWLAALREGLEERDMRLAYTLDSLANLYSLLSRYEQAEMFSRRALDATTAAWGEKHTKTAAMMNSLAGIYYKQKRLSEAENLCQQALRIYESNFGPDAADVGMAANNLAMVLHAQRQFAQAKLFYERALRIRSNALGEDHPNVVTLKKNMAKLIRQMDGNPMDLSQPLLALAV